MALASFSLKSLTIASKNLFNFEVSFGTSLMLLCLASACSQRISTKKLRPICSEFGLIKFRVLVEIRWLQALAKQSNIKEVPKLTSKLNKFLDAIVNDFNEKDAKAIKTIEATTNHDVKAVEYFLKQKFAKQLTLAKVSEFLHFACTSEDINNLSYGLMLKTARDEVLLPQCDKIIAQLHKLAKQFVKQPMLKHNFVFEGSFTDINML
jgi:adenylosuccinate lyase